MLFYKSACKFCVRKPPAVFRGATTRRLLQEPRRARRLQACGDFVSPFCARSTQLQLPLSPGFVFPPVVSPFVALQGEPLLEGTRAWGMLWFLPFISLCSRVWRSCVKVLDCANALVLCYYPAELLFLSTIYRFFYGSRIL